MLVLTSVVWPKCYVNSIGAVGLSLLPTPYPAPPGAWLLKVAYQSKNGWFCWSCLRCVSPRCTTMETNGHRAPRLAPNTRSVSSNTRRHAATGSPITATGAGRGCLSAPRPPPPTRPGRRCCHRRCPPCCCRRLPVGWVGGEQGRVLTRHSPKKIEEIIFECSPKDLEMGGPDHKARGSPSILEGVRTPPGPALTSKPKRWLVSCCCYETGQRAMECNARVRARMAKG